jgi:transposase
VSRGISRRAGTSLGGDLAALGSAQPGARRWRPPPVLTRNTAEHGFARLKQRRVIATRYDKRAVIYLGVVTLAASSSTDRISI